ncbi:MAG TPA: TetR/AcrR family transcriptional regulator [Bacteroidetes bacterium]|nr:TetR/AcrR family transcriptional regulator [Bacteroidota bacterium]
MGKASATRMHILKQSFRLIYQNGYQATSIDKIIETTQVTKGAFYYHFKDKEQMGLAMIREVVAPRLEKMLIRPIRETDNPLEEIFLTLEKALLDAKDYDIQHGCPINNLIQEMSPLKDSFRSILKVIMQGWKAALVEALEKGITLGKVSAGTDTKSVADFIIVSYEGLRGTGKVYQNFNLYTSYLRQLKIYLDILK